jgi:hypothetical protein
MVARNLTDDERDALFEEAHQRFTERIARIDDMILSVLKAQITVEQSMISFLEAHEKNPKQFFFTSKKIEECSRIDPPEVGNTMWNLLSLCSHVRNELSHSLDDKQIRMKADAVRAAYIAATENERQKQSIREMTDTQMVTSALYHCGSLIIIATDNKIAEEQKQKAASSYAL